jgi:5-methylcytosine-specific restriction endonuclease McrA
MCYEGKSQSTPEMQTLRSHLDATSARSYPLPEMQVSLLEPTQETTLRHQRYTREQFTAMEAVRREKSKEYQRRYYIAHREQEKASDHAWQAAHSEQRREYRQRYYVTHYTERSTYDRWWRATHRENCRASWHRYHARKIGNGGTYSAAEWYALCDLWGNKCLYCGATKRLTVDHIVPIKLGGPNIITNLQLLCRSCNSRKGTKIIDYRPSTAR